MSQRSKDKTNLKCKLQHLSCKQFELKFFYLNKMYGYNLGSNSMFKIIWLIKYNHWMGMK